MYTGLYEGAWRFIALCCISIIAQLIFNISMECYTMYRDLSGENVSKLSIIIHSFFHFFFV